MASPSNPRASPKPAAAPRPEDVVITRILETGLEEGRVTYRRLSTLSIITYSLGASYFAAALVLELVFGRSDVSPTVAAFGVAQFATTFLIAPLSRIQTAQSDYTQGKLVLVGYWLKMRALRPYLGPRARQVQRMEAIKAISEATETALAELQTYLEDSSFRRDALPKGSAAAEGRAPSN